MKFDCYITMLEDDEVHNVHLRNMSFCFRGHPPSIYSWISRCIKKVKVRETKLYCFCMDPLKNRKYCTDHFKLFLVHVSPQAFFHWQILPLVWTTVKIMTVSANIQYKTAQYKHCRCKYEKWKIVIENMNKVSINIVIVKKRSLYTIDNIQILNKQTRLHENRHRKARQYKHRHC